MRLGEDSDSTVMWAKRIQAKEAVKVQSRKYLGSFKEQKTERRPTGLEGEKLESSRCDWREPWPDASRHGKGDKLECAERSSSLSGVSATSEKGPTHFFTHLQAEGCREVSSGHW